MGRVSNNESLLAAVERVVAKSREKVTKIRFIVLCIILSIWYQGHYLYINDVDHYSIKWFQIA